jgi:UDP-glucuronate 4-epimerase
MTKQTKWLITGAAGFIGMHVCLRLLTRGDIVIGIDNLNDYYDVNLKYARLARLQTHEAFYFNNIDVSDNDSIRIFFEQVKPSAVIHLAAQAGVRYSLHNPQAYINSNIVGFTNILEGCRNNSIEHLVYASSSSVYGSNTNLPFSEHHNVDHPVSLYAATKKSNELLAHTYSHIFNLPTTGLRFFTVYGPWGRPDMALFIFTRSILAGVPIEVFNSGNMMRDFTFIDDIVEGIIRVADKPATANSIFDSFKPDPATSDAPYRLFNIGNNKPTPLIDYIGALENELGVKAIKKYMPIQPGDVPATAANTDELEAWVGFKPNTSVKEGVAQFVKWYRTYYKLGDL